MNKISLTANDKKIILGWFETFLTHSQHYGNSNVIFPEEQCIQRILKDDNSLECNFTDSQVEIIYSWIEASIHEKYGNAKYLFPDEKNTYDKIVGLHKKIVKDEE